MGQDMDTFCVGGGIIQSEKKLPHKNKFHCGGYNYNYASPDDQGIDWMSAGALSPWLQASLQA